MKISLDKKYKDGYGRAVRILEIDTEISDEYPVRGEFVSPSGKGTPRSWTADGRWWNDDEPREDDLVEVVEPTKPEPEPPAPVAAAPQWKIGEARTLDGSEAHIDFIQSGSEDYRYIGRALFKDGEWVSMDWNSAGVRHGCTDKYQLNLAPTPKKTVRVQRWINVDLDGDSQVWSTKESARRNRSDHFMALLVIDKVVTEGDGLD